MARDRTRACRDNKDVNRRPCLGHAPYRNDLVGRWRVAHFTAGAWYVSVLADARPSRDAGLARTPRGHFAYSQVRRDWRACRLQNGASGNAGREDDSRQRVSEPAPRRAYAFIVKPNDGQIRSHRPGQAHCIPEESRFEMRTSSTPGRRVWMQFHKNRLFCL
jgi:hypothetical protein